MKLKKIITACIVLAVTVSLFAGCGGGDGIKDKDAPSGYEEAMRVLVSDKDSGSVVSGMGVNLYPELFCDESLGLSDIKVLEDRIKELDVNMIRISADPLWYEPLNDNTDSEKTSMDKFSWDNEEMKGLESALTVANSLNIPVILVIRGIKAGTWLGCTYDNYERTAPNDVYEYAENVLALLTYLDSKMFKIDYLTLQDAANTSWVKESGTNLPSYFESVRLIGKGINKSSFSVKPQMITGDDNTSDSTWFKRCTEELSDISYAFSYHTDRYSRTESTENMINDAITRAYYIKSHAENKNLIVSSFGLDGSEDFGFEKYTEGLLYSQLAEQLLCAGVSEMIFRNIADFEYKGVRRVDGLLGSRAEGFAPKETFNALTLISQSMTEGAKAHSVEIYEYDFDGNFVKYYDKECTCAAIKSEDGTDSYLFTNNGRLYARKVTIWDDSISGSFKVRTYSADGITDEGRSVKVKNGKMYVEIPAESFVVITKE